MTHDTEKYLNDLRNYVLGLVPEAMDMEKDHEDFLFEQKFGWNAAREEIIKKIESADFIPFLRELDNRKDME